MFTKPTFTNTRIEQMTSINQQQMINSEEESREKARLIEALTSDPTFFASMTGMDINAGQR